MIFDWIYTAWALSGSFFAIIAAIGYCVLRKRINALEERIFQLAMRKEYIIPAQTTVPKLECKPRSPRRKRAPKAEEKNV
jgi:hypothetical protein